MDLEDDINSQSATFRGQHTNASVLAVDLDGTLIIGDSLWENFLVILKEKPWVLLLVPFWLFKGRAYLKNCMVQARAPEAKEFLYRKSVLDMIRAKKNQGVRVILATAADQEIALRVQGHLGVFDDVIASQDGVNLKSHAKLHRIRDLAGSQDFDYMGNDKADIVIWQNSHHAYLVGEGHLYKSHLKAEQPFTILDPSPAMDIRAYFKTLRLHQWAKNSLIFIPALLAHELFDPQIFLLCALGFLVFSFCASATYILNDLLDLAADRKHASKSSRPLASGRLSIPKGIALSFLLLTAGVLSSLVFLSLNAALMLGGYIILTLAYSFYFKRKLMVDVILLGTFYGYRILFGGVVTGIAVSPWLAIFSLFLFLSLAFVKRHAELFRSQEDLKTNVKGRGYRREDLDMVRSFGASSGYLSILIMALYISSPDVAQNYARPEFLWLTCPVLLYWISRIWFLTERNEMNDDPVLFAIRDWHSRLLAVAVACIMGIATFGF